MPAGIARRRRVGAPRLASPFPRGTDCGRGGQEGHRRRSRGGGWRRRLPWLGGDSGDRGSTPPAGAPTPPLRGAPGPRHFGTWGGRAAAVVAAAAVTAAATALAAGRCQWETPRQHAVALRSVATGKDGFSGGCAGGRAAGGRVAGGDRGHGACAVASCGWWLAAMGGGCRAMASVRRGGGKSRGRGGDGRGAVGAPGRRSRRPCGDGDTVSVVVPG